MFKGIVYKGKSFWLIEVPALDLMTQGHTKKEAYLMIADAVESLVDKKGFKAAVSHLSHNEFILSAKDATALIALLLKRQRAKYGLSLSQVAKRLQCSKNTYAQYEQGRNLPSLKKVREFIEAMSKNEATFVCNVVEEIKKVA